MPEQVLVDNDVTLKVACYSLVKEMLTATSINGSSPAMLGVGKFVVRGRLDRDTRIVNADRAKAAFESLLVAVSLVEPDEAELAVAADLEAEANQRDLELDAGESQLLAILINRTCRLLVTGDKRAIRAIAIVGRAKAEKRIGCLEQLMGQLVKIAGVDTIRRGVCKESKVDRAMSICFGCARTSTRVEEVMEGLASYVGHLNGEAPGILLPGADFSGLVV